MYALTYFYYFSLLILGISFLSPRSVAGQGSSFGSVDTVRSGKSLIVRTNLWVESAPVADPSMLLTPAAASLFHAPNTDSASLSNYVWQRADLLNGGEEMTEQLVHISRHADSIWFYTASETGEILRKSTWFEGSWPKGAYLALPPYTFGINMGPGERLTVLCRIYYQDKWPETFVSHFSIVDARLAINHHFGAVAWHALYSGIMISIGLLSLLNYRLFRNKSFIYFSLVTLSFALYFLDINQLLRLIGISDLHPDFGNKSVFISSIILWLTLFGLSYVNVRRRFPRYYYMIIMSMTVAIFTQFLSFLFDLHVMTIVVWSNLALLTWVVVILAPLVVIAIKGDAIFQRMVAASFILAVPGVLYILNLILNHTYHDYLQVAMELGTLGFSAFLFTSLYTDVSEIRNSAESEREQNLVKSRFFANISHEFRTPLTLIMGSVDRLLHHHPPGTEDRQLLLLAKANANRQLSLVNRVLQLSRLEADEDRLNAELLDLYPLVYETTESFQALAVQRDIDLVFTSNLDRLIVMADRAKVEDALFNLLSNAIKFTPAEGEVTVTLSLEENAATVKVADTGIGIRKDLLPIVFDRFFQSDVGRNQGGAGSGLGLSLVRELIRLHGGRIYAESEIGKGAVFTFTLPVEVDQSQMLRPSDTASTAGSLITDEVVQLTSTHGTPTEAATVLIVEDNRELRAFIRYCLSQDYHVVEAQDGAEGIEKALSLQPELIISDVMMPQKDGFELCAAVKSRVETSHIPIILLTAKSSDDARIEGLSRGADDYLTKPFNDRELLVRVSNLIESRRLLRQRYAASIELKPADVATNDLDAEFLNDAMEIMESHLADESFRVADFARALGMSSASLNRKLRVLLDQSTNQFIRSVRLQRANDLLKNGEHTVAEVADLTGFSSSAYFVKVFKEKYGHTPGTMLKNEEK